MEKNDGNEGKERWTKSNIAFASANKAKKSWRVSTTKREIYRWEEPNC